MALFSPLKRYFGDFRCLFMFIASAVVVVGYVVVDGWLWLWLWLWLWWSVKFFIFIFIFIFFFLVGGRSS